MYPVDVDIRNETLGFPPFPNLRSIRTFPLDKRWERRYLQ